MTLQSTAVYCLWSSAMYCIVYIPLQSSAIWNCGFSTIFQRAVTANICCSQVLWNLLGRFHTSKGGVDILLVD